MDAGQGNGLPPFADSRAFCENLRRAENLRLQNNLSNRQKYYALYYKDGFSTSAWSNYMLAMEGSQIG